MARRTAKNRAYAKESMYDSSRGNLHHIVPTICRAHKPFRFAVCDFLLTELERKRRNSAGDEKLQPRAEAVRTKSYIVNARSPTRSMKMKPQLPHRRRSRIARVVAIFAGCSLRGMEICSEKGSEQGWEGKHQLLLVSPREDVDVNVEYGHGNNQILGAWTGEANEAPPSDRGSASSNLLIGSRVVHRVAAPRSVHMKKIWCTTFEHAGTGRSPREIPNPVEV
ncbi:hypothetical protein B0H16DRAFT_1463253 [Mycena metata]|uniref:Uncharacterized protein n=1 Tax=Mycena metata TaxID=1033252 RepID=A0AAD7IJK9_9AGAR|nr:hypothetical protein B0H16DRAFT_1463253 [Mycena metata]